MKNGKIQNLKEAKDWFANKQNNQDKLGVICERKDGATSRIATVKEAEKFYSPSK